MLQKQGNIIFLLGETKSEFGGSLYMKKMYNKVAGVHPEVDFEKELKLWNTVIEANKQDLLVAAKDVNVGGIAVSLAKMAVVGNKGVKVNVNLANSKDIFSETLSRALVEVNPENKENFIAIAKENGIACEEIGIVEGNTICINDISISLEAASDIYFNKFKKVIEQDL